MQTLRRRELWRRQTENTSDVLAVFLSCALPGNLRRRYWRLCDDASRIARKTELEEAAEQQRQITQIRLRKWLQEMKRISTHILDMVQGKPATEVPVRLGETNWHRRLAFVNRGAHRSGWPLYAVATARRGPLCRNLSYTFLIPASYFSTQKVNTLYPVVEVTFRVQEMASRIFTFRCC